ncbi:unnamed protein product, partial [Rotaria sp. Silwood1]
QPTSANASSESSEKNVVSTATSE